jgi:hypothetical protein
MLATKVEAVLSCSASAAVFNVIASSTKNAEEECAELRILMEKLIKKQNDLEVCCLLLDLNWFSVTLMYWSSGTHACTSG